MEFLKKHRQKIIYILAALTILFLFFLDVGWDAVKKRYEKYQERYILENTVEYYNRALQKTYKENKLSYIEEYASWKEIDRIRYFIAYLVKEKSVQIDTKLLSIAFDKKSKGKNKGNVLTTEVWASTYYDINNKAQIIIPEEKISYKVKYLLVKQKKDWLIDEVKILSEKKVN